MPPAIVSSAPLLEKFVKTLYLGELFPLSPSVRQIPIQQPRSVHLSEGERRDLDRTLSFKSNGPGAKSARTGTDE
jgi:hypothetical protein